MTAAVQNGDAMLLIFFPFEDKEETYSKYRKKINPSLTIEDFVIKTITG